MIELRPGDPRLGRVEGEGVTFPSLTLDNKPVKTRVGLVTHDLGEGYFVVFQVGTLQIHEDKVRLVISENKGKVKQNEA